MADRRRERPDRARVAPSRAGGGAARRRTRAATPKPKVASNPTPRAARATPGVKKADASPPKADVAKRPASPRVRRRRITVAALLSGLLVVGFLFAFVYPTRTYLHQRDQIQASQSRLNVLRKQTKALEADTQKLKTDAEVERIAREQYGLVRPGETPYVLVPATTPTTTPTTAPASSRTKPGK